MRRIFAVLCYVIAFPFAVAAFLVAVPGMLIEALGDAVDDIPSYKSMFPWRN